MFEVFSGSEHSDLLFLEFHVSFSCISPSKSAQVNPLMVVAQVWGIVAEIPECSLQTHKKMHTI